MYHCVTVTLHHWQGANVKVRRRQDSLPSTHGPWSLCRVLAAVEQDRSRRGETVGLLISPSVEDRPCSGRNGVVIVNSP